VTGVTRFTQGNDISCTLDSCLDVRHAPGEEQLRASPVTRQAEISSKHRAQ
jgi:hypothetical protein